MALAPRLDLRQSQSLVMTPQLQQAIRLLALSNVEIEAFIAGELERNPLLEMGRSGSDENRRDDDHAGAENQPEPPSVEVASDAMIDGQAAAADGPLDVDYASETFISDGPGDRQPVSEDRGGPSLSGQASGDYSSGYGDDGVNFDNFASADLSLSEHLMNQARQALSGYRLLIASQLIGQLDEAGYLEADLLQTAYALNVSRHEVEEVLSVIHSFDPIGVGARSLAECLELQAREADRYDPAMALLIGNLGLLAKGALPQLRRICNVDEEDMADMIRELRNYNPKPGLRFAHHDAQTVIPDLFVNARGEGWSVEINGATLPRLLVNRQYYVELSGGVQDKNAKAWLSDCLTNANWLVKALDQRQKTIIKVASEIVKQQEEFFRHGIASLKPLTLRAVADAIGLHESTVSRVTSNKYLSCKRGVYELKFFFTSGISSSEPGGEAVSAEAIKSHIRTLIGNEDPRRILSDDTLVDLLRAQGFDIARRTVAKYREAMGIGSSVQRRRQKALAG
ncbi:MAG: RNA polymerase factor sigma-54 [Sphingobium sp.]